MRPISRRTFLGRASAMCGCAVAAPAMAAAAPGAGARPNILFAIADDWSWPHAGAYGLSSIRTPSFDRVAREGCLFTNAFAAAPQCSPNRAACLTGRNIWQIEEAGTHASHFPTRYEVFTDQLEGAGYHVGFTGKGWGPGEWKTAGWKRNPAGPAYSDRKLDEVPANGINKLDYAGDFDAFLEARADGQPFFFWYGGSEPHRGYEEGSGLRLGKRLADAPVPPFLPDNELVRGDILDYMVEIEWFDAQLGRMLARLEDLGELDNTLVVVTSDNGMPFPRAKANLYEYGTHEPLAVRWPERLPGGRTVDALVTFIDFAPTFFEAAGLPTPEAMTGRSFLGAAAGNDTFRDYALTGRERHTHARYDNLGYPARAIRTHEHLYIRNLKPDRWPAGDPGEFHDVDGGPTKAFMLEHREEFPELFDLAFSKRPEDELYDIRQDPACMRNLAGAPEHADTVSRLRARLMDLLMAQGDPRAAGSDVFDSYPRMSPMRPELGGFAERGQYNPKYGKSSLNE